MNAIDQLLGPDVVYRLGWTLLHSLWQGAAVAVALLLVLAALRRRSPDTRYAAACCATALVLAGPVLTFWLMPEERVAAGVAVSTSEAPDMAAGRAPAATTHREAAAVEAAASSAPVPLAVAPASVDHGSRPVPGSGAGVAVWLPRVVFLWLVGVLGLCVWNVGGWVAVQRLKRAGTTAAGEEIVRRAGELARRLKVSAPVRVVESAMVDVPAVIGWLRPVLLVPASCLGGLSPRQLDAILAHELAHVRRHDYLVNLLQTVVETLLFYHPAAWWVSHRVRVERELCCDDAAVAACGDAVAYADALLHVARRQAQPAPALALAATGPQGGRAGAGAGVLLGRVRRVLGRGPQDASRPRAAAGVGLAAMALAATVLCCIATAAGTRQGAEGREGSGKGEARGGASADNAAAGGPATQPAAPGAGEVVKGEAVKGEGAGPEYVARVVNPKGEPVAGARVSLVVFQERALGEPMRTAASTRTGPDGTFRIRAPGPVGPDDSAPQVLVEALGYGTVGQHLARPPGGREPGASELQQVRMQPATELRVRFVGPDGRPVAGLRVTPSMLVEGSRPGGLFWSVSFPRDAQDRLARLTDVRGACAFPDLPQGASARLQIEDERFAKLTDENRIALAAAAETYAEPIRLRPAASIRGRVAFGDGKPAPGVHVRAAATHASGSNSWGEAVTDEQGAYQVKQLGAAPYNLTVDLGPDLQKEWTAAALNAVPVAAGEHLGGQDFKLIKGGLLDGRVVLKDSGKGVAGTFVGLHGPARPRGGGGIQSARTDAEGRFTFRVPPGKQYVYLANQPPEGYLSPGQSAREPEVAEGQTVTVTIDLPRDPSPPVAGRVELPDGQPAAGAVVTAEPADGMGDARWARADDAGRFRFPALAAGSRLRARQGDFATAEPVVTKGEEADVQLRLRPNAKASLAVTVVDPDGKPVQGARVKLSVQAGQYFRGPTKPYPVTGADGRYVYEALATDGVYHLTADADGFGVSQAKVKKLLPGQPNAADPLVLKRADQRIAGRVVDKAGAPKPGVQVSINSSDTGHRTVTADAEGRFEFRVVSGARPLIFLRKDDGQSVATRGVRAGEENVELVYDPADVQK